ncbi:MAG: alpha/beta hydrolase [Erysipelotrichaceae bacterium]|nr:alpha/beta hydrolase [Erysipelotrichaceae bacterium]
MFLFKKKKRTALVTIHGFGHRTSREFDDLCTVLENPKYDVIRFDYFDPNDEEDTDYQVWIQRCEQKMNELSKEYEHITLLGFSMGGVVASYLSTVYPVEQMILVAPAFQYLNASKIVEYGMKGLRALRNQEFDTSHLLSSKHVYAFTEVVAQYKESITQVECPVLFLHGSQDEVIPVNSSREAYQKVQGKKLFLQVEDGKHKMLYDHTCQEQLFPIIQCMMDHKIFNDSHQYGWPAKEK